jgi:hypothetical protein
MLFRGAVLDVLIIAVLLISSPVFAQSTDYDKLLAQAKSELSAGQNGQALADAKKAIGLKADRWDAHMIAGYALESEKHYDDAIDEFTSALEYAPADKKAAAKKFLEQCIKEKVASGSSSGMGGLQSETKAEANTRLQSPSTPQLNAPTYEETIEWLKGKIAGKFSFTFTEEFKGAGIPSQSTVITISYANFGVTNCVASWDQHKSLPDGDDFPSSTTVKLADLSTNVAVLADSSNIPSGTGVIRKGVFYPAQVTESPQSYNVKIEYTHGGGEWVEIELPDQETAQRVSRAFSFAIQHCGAVAKPEPY